VFHVSQLRKYVFEPSLVLEAEDVQIREDLMMEVQLVAFENRRVEERRGKPSILSSSSRTGGQVTLLGTLKRIRGSHIYMCFLVSLNFRGQKFLLLGRM